MESWVLQAADGNYIRKIEPNRISYTSNVSIALSVKGNEDHLKGFTAALYKITGQKFVYVIR